ncbi:MAG: serine/threonine-protein kinase [Pirellulales bacterium]
MNTNESTNGLMHLSLPELGLLLREDESSDANHAAAGHLESCEMCQSRLTALAAGENWWSDVQMFLSGDVEPRWAPDASQAAIMLGENEDRSEAVQETLRELLGTPQHPEMLGRLGRYDIERVIGHGGMGIVLKAHDCDLNRPIAIKLLAGHLAHVGAARERFAREGRAAAAVVHEHVVAIYNVESNGKVPFLVMQYVPGRSLQARVDEDGPLGTEEILRIGMQAAAGLAAAHRQGLVHRDVKPSNILLEDTVERAVLTDFGLARTFDDASLTHTGILAGTPHYMSPEQASGGPIDPRSDLFSLGAVLYFMATGHPPFRAASAMSVLHRICNDTHRPAWQWNQDIPDELSDVIDRLLEKKPHKRFATAEEVQQQLATLLSRLQQHGLGRRRFRRWGGKRLRRRVLAGGAALLALVGVACAVTLLPTATPPLADDRIAATVADASAVAELEKRFVGDLGDVESALRDSTSESFFLQSGDDPWRRELQSLKRDLTEYETINTTLTPCEGDCYETVHD